MLVAAEVYIVLDSTLYHIKFGNYPVVAEMYLFVVHVFTCYSGIIHHDITEKINESGLKDPYITLLSSGQCTNKMTKSMRYSCLNFIVITVQLPAEIM